MEKKRKLSPSNLQLAAVNRMVELGGMKKRISVSNVMREVGFSARTAKTPSKLTRSPTFIQLCDDMGLTDDFLIRALHDDIKKKPRNRKGEIELAFKIKGKLKEAENTNPFTQNNIIVFDESQLSRIARRALNGDTPSEEKSN